MSNRHRHPIHRIMYIHKLGACYATMSVLYNSSKRRFFFLILSLLLLLKIDYCVALATVVRLFIYKAGRIYQRWWTGGISCPSSSLILYAFYSSTIQRIGKWKANKRLSVKTLFNNATHLSPSKTKHKNEKEKQRWAFYSAYISACVDMVVLFSL